jgi:hypothetical protein
VESWPSCTSEFFGWFFSGSVLTVRCDIQGVHFAPNQHSPTPGIVLLNEILDAIHFTCPQCSEHQWFVSLAEWTAMVSERLKERQARNEVKYLLYQSSLELSGTILACDGLSKLGGGCLPRRQGV